MFRYPGANQTQACYHQHLVQTVKYGGKKVIISFEASRQESPKQLFWNKLEKMLRQGLGP